MCYLDPNNGNAIIAVAGTLLGAAVGAGLTFLQQRAQREHADLVRFHDERLKVYVDLSAAAMSALSASSLWMQGEQNVRLVETIAPFIGAVTQAATRVRFLASDPVMASASQLVTSVAALTREPFDGDLSAHLSDAYALMGMFERSVRTELGITRAK
jgi:hypothetical protein